MSLREIDRRLGQLRDVLAEAHCSACGGWDTDQGGSGHRRGCPLGAVGARIGASGDIKPDSILSTLKEVHGSLQDVIDNHVGTPENTTVYQLAASVPNLAMRYAHVSGAGSKPLPTKADLTMIGSILKRAGYHSNADFEKDNPQGDPEFIRLINEAARYMQQNWLGDESQPEFKEEMKNFKAGLRLLGVDPSKIKFSGYDWGFYAA